jgi:hypothetical protein
MPEQIFVVCQNNIGSGTAIVKDMPVQLDISTSVDGVKAVTPTTAGIWCYLGVADAAIADQDYGLVQVYGYRSSSIVFTTDTSIAAGAPLIPANAVSYLQTVATTQASNAAVTFRPFMAALAESIASTSASATISAKLFIKALGF